MKSPNGAVAQFRFSTDDIAERERLTAWREVLRRAITVLDIAPVGRRAFGADATVCQLPGLSVLSVSSSAVHLAHTSESAGGGLSFLAAPTCRWTASQLGRELKLAPGDGVLLTNADTWSVTLTAPSRFTIMRVPATAIAPRLPDLAAATARLIPAANVALRLLVAYLAASLDIEALIAPEMTQLGVAHVHDLLAVALGARPTDTAKGRGTRAARLTPSRPTFSSISASATCRSVRWRPGTAFRRSTCASCSRAKAAHSRNSCSQSGSRACIGY